MKSPGEFASPLYRLRDHSCDLRPIPFIVETLRAARIKLSSVVPVRPTSAPSNDLGGSFLKLPLLAGWINPRPSQPIGRTRGYCSAARRLGYRKYEASFGIRTEWKTSTIRCAEFEIFMGTRFSNGVRGNDESRNDRSRAAVT